MDNKERLYRTDAIVLRRADFGEADRLLTVYTPNRGKLRLLAKGVRKVSSRKAGHVELFMLTNMMVARGRTWDIVSQAEIVEAYRQIREDLDLTSSAYYLAELLDRFSEEHNPNEPLYKLFALALAYLDHADDAFMIMRYFEIRILSLTGYQPQLHYCLSCQEALEPVENNYFHFVDGGTLCPTHGEPRPNAEIIPLAVLKVLRFLQTEPWEKVINLQLTPTTRQQVETLLLGYVTYILERQLKSIEFLRKLRRENQG